MCNSGDKWGSGRGPLGDCGFWGSADLALKGASMKAKRKSRQIGLCGLDRLSGSRQLGLEQELCGGFLDPVPSLDSVESGCVELSVC